MIFCFDAQMIDSIYFREVIEFPVVAYSFPLRSAGDEIILLSEPFVRSNVGMVL